MRSLFFKIFIIFWIAQTLIFVISTALILARRFPRPASMLDPAFSSLRAEAAAKRIDVAHAAFYPNVNLTAYVGVQSLGLNMLGKSGSDIGSFGPAISLPIFNTGHLQGQYRGARGEYDAAVASYDATVTRNGNEWQDRPRAASRYGTSRASVPYEGKQAMDRGRERRRRWHTSARGSPGPLPDSG